MEDDLTLTHRLWGIVWIVLMRPFSWQCQNLCFMSLAFIIDWKVVLWINLPKADSKRALFWNGCWIQETFWICPIIQRLHGIHFSFSLSWEAIKYVVFGWKESKTKSLLERSGLEELRHSFEDEDPIITPSTLFLLSALTEFSLLQMFHSNSSAWHLASSIQVPQRD